MNEQEVREIAEAAFKGKFPDVKLHRVNVWPDAGFEDDSPTVDMSIIYDGKYEQLNAAGLGDVILEVVDKAYYGVEDALGFPCLHFSPRPSLNAVGATWPRCDAPARSER